MWCRVLSCRSSVARNKMTIKSVDGSINHVEWPRWNLYLLHNKSNIYMSLDRIWLQYAWLCRTKSIWDIEFIRYSIYSWIKKHNIELYKGDIIYMSRVQYRYKGKKDNYTHDPYHGKVSSDHMTFSSLG
jgi:hypothetical protein